MPSLRHGLAAAPRHAAWLLGLGMLACRGDAGLTAPATTPDAAATAEPNATHPPPTPDISEPDGQKEPDAGVSAGPTQAPPDGGAGAGDAGPVPGHIDCRPWPAVNDPGGCTTGSPGAPEPEQAQSTPAGLSVHRNLTYATRGQRALQGDLWVPQESASPPGLLVVVHGGGWSDCERRREATEWYAAAMAQLFDVGAFNIEYRLVQDGGAYPENLRDVKCAVQWIARHAGDYGLDGSRILIAGESAGAHLALMTALSDGRADLDPGCGEPTTVAGAIAFSAPTDLPQLVARSSAVAETIEKYVGPCTRTTAGCREAAHACEPCVDASPVAHTCDRTRPTPHLVLVQAVDPFDPLIPESQAHALSEALTVAGITHDLVVVDADSLRAEGCLEGVLDLRTPHGLLQGQTCLTTPSGPAVERLVRRTLLP